MPSSDSEQDINDHGNPKRRAKRSGSNVFDLPSTADNTPTKRKRGRPPGSGKKALPALNGTHDNSVGTPKGKGKVLFSASAVITRKRGEVVKARTGDEDVAHLNDDIDEEEDFLVRNIQKENEEATSSSGDDQSDEIADSTPITPSKKGPRKRRKDKSPNPQDLPPHEQFFWQNKPGRVKTSNNTFPLPLLTHEQFHDHLSSYKDPHAEAYESLHQIHTRSFPQWRFELSEDFNICLYGYGSKRRLVTEFAQYLHDHLPSAPKIFIINGYTQNLVLRHVFTSLATLVYDCSPGELPAGLGSRPQDVLTAILAQMTAEPPEEPIYVFINSLDAATLRRHPVPALFARLAAHPSIHLLATCDTPNFPLLWDAVLREQYCWLFHDTTTFISFAGVEIPGVVDEVNQLLGRSGRSIKGKGGAGFVLKSLPENARNLYRVLIAEILTATDEGNGLAEDAQDGQGRGRGEMQLGGIERKVLYQKAVEDFICSNEMGFGQLLNEFYDHDMLVDTRDADGTKVLGVPWRREECEEILEELIG